MTDSVREHTGAIVSGDPEAFSRFYRDWFDHCLREARHCTGRDEHFCLDAVQETMLRVIRHLKPLDSDAAVAAWLRAAVRSACIDLLRRDLRQRRRDHRRAASATEIVNDERDIERDTLDRIDWLRGQLDALPAEQARLLDMRFRMGWTLARIGRSLGLKAGAVDGRINRTLAHLRSTRCTEEDAHD